MDKGLFLKLQYNLYDSKINNTQFGKQTFNEIQMAIVVGF
jgi:hypothetical protein